MNCYMEVGNQSIWTKSELPYTIQHGHYSINYVSSLALPLFAVCAGLLCLMVHVQILLWPVDLTKLHI